MVMIKSKVLNDPFLRFSRVTLKTKGCFTFMARKSLLLLMVLFFCQIAVRADVSLFLHEAIGASGEETSAGHAAIYFSNLCSDGPLNLRLCRPGETGVVISAYPEWGTDKPYKWLALPLLTYLYGVDDGQDIPLYTNGKVRRLLRTTARRKYFKDIVAEPTDGSWPKGRWTEALGTVLNRDIYAMTLKTTPQEDAAFLEKFTQLPNVSNFSTMYRNCADFARETINLYFPHATHRDVLNDFTMTTPKALARSLTGYASKRPERLFNITKYSQLSGPIRRSLDNRNFSEHALFSKKYLIPQIILKQELLVVFSASYFLTGYFNPHQQYRKYANPEIAQLNLAESQLKQPSRKQPQRDKIFVNHFVSPEPPNPKAELAELASKKEAVRLRLFGNQQTWDKYKSDFAPLLQKAIANELFVDEKEVTTFFKDLELQSDPFVDGNGALMLKVKAYGKDYQLGLTRNNILSQESDLTLAYKLMLAKINYELKAREKNRESMADFESDWALLTELAARVPNQFAVTKPAQHTRPRFLEHPEKKTFGQKLKKAFVIITH